ncbi:hypothetical protein METSCH_A12990 [Metschnikowia aff. pulcherrima]|uniref:Uncharacterized protein n=1 Tax=Metschnikowia aff. pulcherrima TaxID=2163413 RepID=A0A4V1ADR7_9ASCO|nr:hypothetical protein METSCH_A12990 [Metschnikowia aff. pulcherrima]
MSNEYYAVILEIDEREVKLGFAGESTAHVRVTSKTRLWKDLVPHSESRRSLPAFLQVDSHAISQSFKNDMLDELFSPGAYRDMLQAFERDRAEVKWFKWGSDNYRTLSAIVNLSLSSKLLVSPLKTKLFIIDKAYSALEKALVCKTFLRTNTAASITFLPYSPCCCISSGVENALVVALEWSSCKLVPVLDLRSLPAKELVQFTGESVHYSPTLSHKTKNFEEVELEIYADKGIIESALFLNGELPAKIAAVVKGLEIDSRACVAENIIFTGSLSQISGVKGRILTEVASHLPGYNVAGKVCLGAWAGASLYCSTTLLKQKSSEWKHLEISRAGVEKTSTAVLEAYQN